MLAIIYHILFSSSSPSSYYYYYTLYVLLLYTVFPCSFFNAVKCVGLTSEVVVEPPLHPSFDKVIVEILQFFCLTLYDVGASMQTVHSWGLPINDVPKNWLKFTPPLPDFVHILPNCPSRLCQHALWMVCVSNDQQNSSMAHISVQLNVDSFCFTY